MELFSGSDYFAPPARFGSWGRLVRNLVNAQDWDGFVRIMRVAVGGGWAMAGGGRALVF